MVLKVGLASKTISQFQNLQVTFRHDLLAFIMSKQTCHPADSVHLQLVDFI